MAAMPEISVAAITRKGRNRRYAIEMAHPDLRPLDALPKRITTTDGRSAGPYSPRLPFLNFATQVMGEQLVPVTNTQHRNFGGENRGIDIRRFPGAIFARRTAGNNHSLTRTQLGARRVTRLHVRIYSQFADSPRDRDVVYCPPVSKTVICGLLGFFSIELAKASSLLFKTRFQIGQEAMLPSAWRRSLSLLRDPARRRPAANLRS